MSPTCVVVFWMYTTFFVGRARTRLGIGWFSPVRSFRIKCPVQSKLHHHWMTDGVIWYAALTGWAVMEQLVCWHVFLSYRRFVYCLAIVLLLCVVYVLTFDLASERCRQTVGLLDYGKKIIIWLLNPIIFGQYWNHDYSNDYFWENMMHLFSISSLFNQELKKKRK